MVAYNPTTGIRQWEFDCRESTGIYSCQESVEAEFTISTNGNLLVYGDIFGRLNGLQIASHSMSTPPLLVPTRDPNLPVPTRHPRPVVSPTTTPLSGHSPQQPQSTIQNTTATANTAGIAAGVIIGVVAVIGVGLVWFVSRHRRNGNNSKRKCKVDELPRASTAPSTSLHRGNSSDVHDHAGHVGVDRRSQVLADIFQQNIAQGEEAASSVPPPVIASDVTDEDAIEMIRSATNELSSRISSGLQTMTKTLSETNLASLESSVIPFLSFGAGCAVEIDELSDTGNTDQGIKNTS